MVILQHSYFKAAAESVNFVDSGAPCDQKQHNVILFTCLCRLLSIHNISTLSLSPPQALQLNSTENERLAMIAKTIGIPSAPVLKAVSENYTLVSIF